MYKLGTRSQEVYESGLDRNLLAIIDRQLINSPIDFMLVDGLRTAEEQWELWKVGRRWVQGRGPEDQPDSWMESGAVVVTYCDGIVKESRHQSGMAIDICAYIPGRNDLNYDRVHMAVLIGSFLTMANHLFDIGAIDMKLRSGADWDRDTQYLEPGTFIDMPHLELIKP